MTGYPDNNPKTMIGAVKVPLHLVPPSAIHHLALAFKDGAGKYGPYNWRDQMVSASVYVGAAKRHIDAWWDGENLSRDALVEHLAHVMACCAIVLDAQSVGMLNDDRPTAGAAAALQAEYAARNARYNEYEASTVTAMELAATDGITADGGGIVLDVLYEHSVAEAAKRDLLIAKAEVDDDSQAPAEPPRVPVENQGLEHA